jgi:hypothetical protein
MKTHRPWQPHMGNSPLFNPYTPAGHATTLDHFDLIEEQVDETEAEASGEERRDEAMDPPPVMKRD